MGSADISSVQLALPPEDGSGRPSAVLIALSDNGSGPSILLTKRAASLRNHAGQVAFPGGATDPEDSGPVATALREAHEEVGLDQAEVEVLLQLPELFLPPSGFVVTPILAWLPKPRQLAVVDTDEVAKIAQVPIAELTNPANRFRVPHPSGYVGPGFAAHGLFVWGFTAMLLDRLLDVAGWTRPWDRTVLREVPC